jgi:CRISPR-associated protein Cas2
MYRFMRILALYDLPQVTPVERAAYRVFNKKLIKAGFVRLQFSVYTKLVMNSTQQKRYEEFLRREKPGSGSRVMMTLTEKQYADKEFLLGESDAPVLQTDERLVLW